jgi:hypothetical protein
MDILIRCVKALGGAALIGIGAELITQSLKKKKNED